MSGVIVECGLDNPLMTFFGIAQKTEPVDDLEPMLLWVGASPRECLTADDLARHRYGWTDFASINPSFGD